MPQQFEPVVRLGLYNPIIRFESKEKFCALGLANDFDALIFTLKIDSTKHFFWSSAPKAFHHQQKKTISEKKKIKTTQGVFHKKS